jgi:NAD(P)H-hydrate epimerase
MATAGSGDVLTGIITSFIAQGYVPEEAAKLGVFLHGKAGDLAMEAIGGLNIIASDLLDYYNKAVQSVGI